MQILKNKNLKQNNDTKKLVLSKTMFILLSVIFITFILIVSGYAYFNAQEITDEKAITSTNLNISFSPNEFLIAKDLMPLSNEEINDEAVSLDFSITNNDKITGYFTVKLNELQIADELKNPNVKWRIVEGDSIVSEGTFDNAKETMALLSNNSILKNETKNYTLMVWIQETEEDQNLMMDKELSAKVSIKIMDRLRNFAISENPTLTGTVQGNAVGGLIINGNSQLGINLYDNNNVSLTKNMYLKNDGTTVSNSVWSVTDYIPVDSYSFTLYNVTGNVPSICAYDENKTFITGINYGISTTDILGDFTISSSTKIKYIRFSIYTKLDKSIIKLLQNPTPTNPVEILSLGSKENKIEIVSSGKNLIPDLTIVSNWNSGNMPGVTNTTAYKWLNLKDYVKDNQQITFSYDYDTLPYYFYFSTNDPILSGKTDGSYKTNIYLTAQRLETKTKTFVVNKQYDYIIYSASQYNDTVFPNWLSRFTYFQLEYGPTATSYEPYQTPITTTIDLTGHEPLRKIGNYADYIDFDKKQIVRNIKQVKLKDINWGTYSMVGGKYRYEATVADKLFTEQFSANILSNGLITAKYNESIDNSISERANMNNLKILTSECSTKNELIEKYGNLDIYYVLATKREGESITLPSIPTLNGTTVLSMSNDIKGTFEGKY